MKQDIIDIMHECATRSSLGNIRFPEVVQKLAGVGVEQYHADLMRGEKTYYLPDGGSHVESMSIIKTAENIATDFSAKNVILAIKAIQNGEMLYPAFLEHIMSAGCVSYFVYIRGRRAIYFGRTGDYHVENFPSPSSS